MTGKMMRARVGLAAMAVLALGALSACGDAQAHPGIAATTGDQSITDNAVNSTAQDVCTALQSSEQLIGTGYARSTLLQSVVQSFVMRAMASQMAEEYGVEPTESYKRVVDQTKLQFASLDPDVRANIMDTWTASNYFVDILTQIGKQALEKEGTTSPSANDSLAKGISLAQDWEDKNGISIAPRFPDISLADDSFTRTNDQTAFAVSDSATKGSAEQADAEWVKSLPASQKCV